jgi:hypothetical protein
VAVKKGCKKFSMASHFLRTFAHIFAEKRFATECSQPQDFLELSKVLLSLLFSYYFYFSMFVFAPFVLQISFMNVALLLLVLPSNWWLKLKVLPGL